VAESKVRKDRRKVNQAVGADKRLGRADRRRCPNCGSTVRQFVEAAPGGTVTRLYCTKCEWKMVSRQVDEERIKALAGFELTVHGSVKRAMLELDADFMKAAQLLPGDKLELKAIYVPGTETVLTWVLRKLE
jgi:ribosomal protein S27AE